MTIYASDPGPALGKSAVLVEEADGELVGWRATDRAAHTYLSSTIAGERAVDSATASYLVARDEANATRLDIDQTETLVTAAPCHVIAVIGNEGNTGYTDLIDASATGGGSTPVVRCDVAAGASLNLHGARFENGLCVDGESAGHDVTVLWRPIG